MNTKEIEQEKATLEIMQEELQIKILEEMKKILGGN